MAKQEWLHFEATWTMTSWVEKEGKSERISFAEWLDLQCEDGWEVLKISRDFNDHQYKTWVVFRKLMRIE